MAAILKLRRGSTTPTSLEQSELFYNSALATLQVGKSSATDDNITLVKLTEVNTGNLQIVGTISGSQLTLSGDITANDISARDAVFSRNIHVGGQIYLGDSGSTADNIFINAPLSGSIIPQVNGQDDLGSNTYKWNNVYANNLNGSVTDSNLLNFTQSINSFTSSQETKDSTLATYTGSIDTKFTTLASYTGSVNSDLSLLHEFTTSQETKDSTLATYTGSVNSQLTELYSTASNHETRLDLVEGEFSSSLYGKVTSLINNTGSYATTGSNTFVSSQYISGALEIYSASLTEIRLRNGDLGLDYHIQSTAGGNFSIHNNQLNASIFRIESGSSVTTSHAHIFGSLYVSKSVIAEEAITAPLITATNLLVNGGTISGSINGIGNVSEYSASVDSRILSLNSYTASNDSDITELYSTASNHETRVDGIQDYTSSLRTAIGVNGSNVTINGDLSVLGTTTQINSTQVNIGENILELNYGGSATTAGIITKDATGTSLVSGSLIWDSANGADYWKAGKLGDESKILLAGGDDVVSGSGQVVDALKATFLEINGDNVVSGSSQIDLVQTTNYVSGIKSQLNINAVVSGSSQINLVDTADYVSAIKNRLNIESVISSSTQVDVYNTTNFTPYSSSVDSRLIALSNDDISQASRLDNLELFSGSEITKNSTLETYTSSNDTKWSTLENVTSSLINATSSYETRGNNIVSGSSQLTESYDLRYANSSSFHNLVGEWDFGTQGSIRDAAFYSVTSSADIALVSGSINYNNNHLLTAGATKKYIDWRTDEILTAIAVADITSVTAGDGISGGGVSGDVTMSLDTASAHFTNAVKTKLNTESVVSGSSQIVSILGPLNTFSSSEETKNSTLATYTGSVNSQLTELFGTASNHEVRIDNLESWSSSLDTSFVTETELTNLSQSIDSRLDNLELFSGSEITKNSTLATYTGSVDTNLSTLNSFSSSIDTTIKTKLNTEGVISGSSQIVVILDPLNAFTASQETKNTTLATYTGSVDSSLSQLNAVSHSHSNKIQLDTINQNLANTSDVTFGSIHTSGTGSIGTNLTVYGNLTVWGTQSIINSENLSVNDNLIYLAPTASGDWDLGIVGHYNDGTYKHAGIFSDASDGHAWKVFKDLTPETTGSVDTSAPSFTLADFKAANFTGTSFNGIINATNGVISGSLQAQLPVGVISGSSQVDADSITNFDANVLAYNNSLGVVSGSSQVNADSITNFDANVLAYNNSLGVVSGSSQITLSSTTGGGTSANVQFGSLGIGMAASGTTGRIDATNDIVAYSSSDRRFKDNIKPIENALDKVNQIGGYEFDWKEENKSEHGYEGHDLGVIAQEIEAIAPELVQTRENGYKAVKYDKLVSVLIQAVKELSAKVTELENK